MNNHNAIKNYTVVLVVAGQGYQPIEYSVTKEILEEAGIKVITSSNLADHAIASDGSSTHVDIPLDKIDVNTIHGIFLIGGQGTMESLDNETTYQVIRAAKKRAIPYGAICLAPRVLAKGDCIDGVHATGWNGDNLLPAIFKADGIEYVDKDVVIDGLLVTASSPAVAENFAHAIIRVLDKKFCPTNKKSAASDLYYEVK